MIGRVMNFLKILLVVLLFTLSMQPTIGTESPAYAITDVGENASSTFSATSVGNSTVNATNETITGNGSVTINSVSSLESITVSPSSVMLNPEGTISFNATVRDQYGNPISGINISWTAFLTFIV